jgi:hypothetical protein
MGYAFFAPQIVYGFVEIDESKLICRDFLDEYELNLYCQYTNKGFCFGFIYGISCNSLEEISTLEKDKEKVDNVFRILSEKRKDSYVAPKLMLALTGDMDTSEHDEYWIE